MKIVYLLMAMVFIIAVIGGFMMLIDLIELYTVTNRVESKIIAAGWTAFSEVDLDVLARRYNIENEELRDIFLNKERAENKVIEHIEKNLKLDEGRRATNDSFISVKHHPVLIEEVKVFNPGEFPAIHNSKSITETSIYVRLQFPLNIVFVGDVYKEVSLIVDTKSFYSQQQR